MLMSASDYRESLREQNPRVFVKGQRIECVADEPLLRPGINAIGLTYDYALRSDKTHLSLARQHTTDQDVNRFLHIGRTSTDLLTKLEYVRVLCQETGCAMRYLTGDGFNALYQSTYRLDDQYNTDYHQRFLNYLHEAQARDLTVGIAMTDGKGDRSLRPCEQSNLDSYVHIVERRPGGIIISGVKAIVTSAPYVHELLVVPGRAMREADKDFAVACAVPLDSPGLTIVARPAGRPGESAASFSGQYGQSTGVCMFDQVFVPYERVFMDGEWADVEFLTKSYATHHRHTCIGARAGFGDLLIGAGALMMEANGVDSRSTSHLRDTMVELIKIVEGFYACGVASSVYGIEDVAGNIEPEPVYANIGKLLLATQIYDMHRLANEVSGGLVVTLPTPEDEHNPETAGDLASMLAGRADIPFQQRASVARFMEDLTASETAGWYSTISLHGGGSPQAMKGEIHRRYPIHDKAELVQRLIDRGAADNGRNTDERAEQPGQCCDTGCVPEAPTVVEFQGKKA
ncbi:MAG: 4-hydroxybutyryl-CoA dehydratase/vinylacetyl-CoA-Delta-isomerase [Parasphingorhabdus sp.]|jgi:4-hydroxybutyryl-CoA dehydratase/vinylacetyl-CoA-Delta-isomerase